MRFQSYFNTAIKIIQLYNGIIPLSHFLKQYFSENKKHGSKDRKLIAHACYNYFRIGCALKNLSAEERLKVAIFLCNGEVNEWKILYDDKWLTNWSKHLNERISYVQSAYKTFSEKDIFSFNHQLSTDINTSLFIQSHLIQPNVFLRIRKNYKEDVIKKLKEKNISFSQPGESIIEVSNAVKLDDVLKIDEEVVIQDYSSQQVKKFLQLIQSKTQQQKQLSVWDCCAASGGKSILANDILQNIQLTVSDVRASILHNLEKRFEKAGIKNYTSFVADITKTNSSITNKKFDLIICDAPCSGSGTWSRTPEQLYFFNAKKIDDYSALQKKIITNVIDHLNDNGFFLYITCSVFTTENEDIVSFIQNSFPVNLLKAEVLKGYTKKADTMFAALFKKSATQNHIKQ